MGKKVKIEKELRRIKPIELKAEKKETEERKEQEKKEEELEELTKEEFHDISIWQVSGFKPETLSLTAKQESVENLEEFAESIQSAKKTPEQEISYALKATGKSYMPAADYLAEQKKYAEKEEATHAPVLEAKKFEERLERIMPISPAPKSEAEFSNQRHEFEKQLEQYRLEMQEKARLPFQRIIRKTEIF